MLHVHGQQRKASRLWRHALASALWSRQVAHRLGGEMGLVYLCGLLHNIGKVVALGAVQDIAQRAGQELDGEDYDRLIEIFHRDVGKRVIAAWSLPPPVRLVIEHWDNYPGAGELQWESNVVNVAHKLADFTLHEPEMMKRAVFMLDQGLRDLGCRDRTPRSCSTRPHRSTLKWTAISRHSRGNPFWIIVSCMKDTTLVNHPPEAELAGDNRALVSPIYQSVKFSFDNVNETLRYQRGEREGFYYSRSSNPTLTQLQRLLAGLQGRDDCLLTGSGVATISASLLALCKAGDHVLLFVESYGPTRYIVQHLLAKFGVTHTMLSIEDLAAIERLLKEKPTRLAIFESPTNPITKIADIEHLTAHARRANCLTVLDNTFAGFHNHGGYDVDIYLHSLTKYASGHGDHGGAIIGAVN